MNEQEFTVAANDVVERITSNLSVILYAPENAKEGVETYDDVLNVLKEIDVFVGLKVDEALPK